MEHFSWLLMIVILTYSSPLNCINETSVKLPTCNNPTGADLSSEDFLTALLVGCIYGPALKKEHTAPSIRSNGSQPVCVPQEQCHEITLTVNANNSRKSDGKSVLRTNVSSDCIIDGYIRCPQEFISSAYLSKLWESRENKNCGRNAGGGINRSSSDAVAGELPWMAIIGRRLTADSVEYVSGGVLIHPRFVLTTAHRFALYPNKCRFTVNLRELNISDPQHSITMAVKRVVIHARFEQRTRRNNIALLVLDTAATLTNHTATICLPRTGQQQVHQQCLVTGWGLDQNNSYIHHLRKVAIRVLPRDQCPARFGVQGNSTETLRATSNSFCGRDENMEHRVCKGFDGSPLVCRKQNGAFVLTGLVSDDNDCHINNGTALYTDVKAHLGWIHIQLASL